VVEGALEVAKDALRNREMGLMRVVHVMAHRLDRVRDIRTSVLESPDQAVESLIGASMLKETLT
jgi:hypothetical protein